MLDAALETLHDLLEARRDALKGDTPEKISSRGGAVR